MVEFQGFGLSFLVDLNTGGKLLAIEVMSCGLKVRIFDGLSSCSWPQGVIMIRVRVRPNGMTKALAKLADTQQSFECCSFLSFVKRLK